MNINLEGLRFFFLFGKFFSLFVVGVGAVFFILTIKNSGKDKTKRFIATLGLLLSIMVCYFLLF